MRLQIIYLRIKHYMLNEERLFLNCTLIIRNVCNKFIIECLQVTDKNK